MVSGSELGKIKTLHKSRTSAENGRRGGRPRREAKTFTDLWELTGHEAGAILYEDDTIWIGNWDNINGIPRTLDPFGAIGLGEELIGTRCTVPADVIRAMQVHEREQGDKVSRSGFRAWRVNDVTVVIQSDWN